MDWLCRRELPCHSPDLNCIAGSEVGRVCFCQKLLLFVEELGFAPCVISNSALIKFSRLFACLAPSEHVPEALSPALRLWDLVIAARPSSLRMSNLINAYAELAHFHKYIRRSGGDWLSSLKVWTLSSRLEALSKILL